MKLFSKVRNVNDIKETFMKNYDSSNQLYFSDIVESGLDSMNHLDDVSKNNLVIYSGIIDSYFGLSNEQNVVRDELSTVLTTAILLDKHYDETKVLNEKEFLTLAYFLTYEDIQLIDNYVKLYNKEILNLLCSRFDNYALREDVLEIVDCKISNLELNNHEDMFKYISDIKNEDIKSIHSALMDEISSKSLRGIL